MAKEADTAWIVEQVGRGSLDPSFVEAFTRLASNINWLDVRRHAIGRQTLPDEEKLAFRYRVRDVMGALESRDFFKKLNAEVEYLEDAPGLGQRIRFSENTSIKTTQLLGPLSEKAINGVIEFHAGDEAIVISRIWNQQDYNMDKPNDVYSLLTRASGFAPYRILAVSNDFKHLSEEHKNSVVSCLTDRDANLLILKVPARTFKDAVKELFRRLDPKPPTPSSKNG